MGRSTRKRLGLIYLKKYDHNEFSIHIKQATFPW